MKHPKLHTIVFAVTLTVSVGLVVAGFLVPPMGVIDGSVLTAVGELFAFAALSQLPYVVAHGKNLTLSHGNTSLSVNHGSTGASPVNRSTGASPVNNEPDDDQDPC